MGLSKATMEYYEVDYLDEAYDTFWREHDRLLTDIVALRSSFAPVEKTDLCGFSDSDEEDIDEDNRDCLHMMRSLQKMGCRCHRVFRCDKATIFADDNYTIYGHAENGLVSRESPSKAMAILEKVKTPRCAKFKTSATRRLPHLSLIPSWGLAPAARRGVR